ncbi:cation:proton antiporter [Zobellia laminariae]|uniref:cation:proton antiporter n=1 Tax=Zobellia laminariae TaxID=248906 RepID=UPI0012D87F68|nr:cation:proton antiporter [Zobellia laminariae]
MEEFLNHLSEHFRLPLDNPVLIFSLILFIILLAPILLSKIRVPGIIGLILSGIIIGPHGLRLLEEGLFVQVFSTIGLLYIMFIAGLELDINEFRAYRNKSLLFGLLTFSIPLIVGFPVCHYILGYGVDASFLTASMFSTHTLVTYPIVSRIGVSKNQAVAITVGGTILTDTAVLLILAVIMGSHEGNLGLGFWVKMIVSLIVFSLIMFKIVPKIAAWFFKKMQTEKHSHYIFVLAIIFFAAFLAEVAGFEPIIGAFVSGLALNRLIPHSSALMNRIEFIGNSLFIPFFLISVGMLVDIKVILSGPMALIIAATLTVVSIFGKWLAAFVTQLVYKYSINQRNLIFGLSSAHAAATLAVILVGYKAKILDSNILNGTVILILFTCIIASFVTEKAAKRIVVDSEAEEFDEQATTSFFKNEHILMPIANPANMDKALEFAILIKDKKSTHPITILTVVPNNIQAEKNIMKSKERLELLVKEATAAETVANLAATIDLNPAAGIVRTARETMVDTIIMGWPENTGFIEKLVGEKMDSVLNQTDKVLFICHFHMPLTNHRRILLAVPKLAEREKGFKQWVDKIVLLASEISVPVMLYCNDDTEKYIKEYLTSRKIKLSITFNNLTNWDDFLIISKEIQVNDLFILVSARKGSVSHIGALDNIPKKLEGYFNSYSRIIIYP